MVPSAAITLETAAGLTPTGVGAVCYRAAEGAAFAEHPGGHRRAARRRRRPRRREDPSTTTASPGWSPASDDMSALCTDLHTVNTMLEEQGFGPGLLCSIVTFRDDGGRGRGAGVPLQAGHLLSFRSVRQAAATTCSSSRSATTSPVSCRWSPTCNAGWPYGEHRDCEQSTVTTPPGWRRSSATRSWTGRRAASCSPSSTSPRGWPTSRWPRSTCSPDAEQHQVATYGFDGGVCSYDDAMCSAVVEGGAPIVTYDARKDERFSTNPFVTGDLGNVRFYASHPLDQSRGRHDRHAVRLRREAAARSTSTGPG